MDNNKMKFNIKTKVIDSVKFTVESFSENFCYKPISKELCYQAIRYVENFKNHILYSVEFVDKESKSFMKADLLLTLAKQNTYSPHAWFFIVEKSYRMFYMASKILITPIKIDIMQEFKKGIIEKYKGGIISIYSDNMLNKGKKNE